MKKQITGFNNRKINVTEMLGFNSPDLFIHFPGYAYGPDHPFFFYLGKYLKNLSVDQVFFDYRWSEQDEMFSDKSKIIDNLKDEIFKGYQYIESLEYKNLHVVGKSMGTTALELSIDEIEKYRVKSLYWVTPFTNTEKLNGNDYSHAENYFYVGNRDQFYIKEVYEILEKSEKVKIFDGLDHPFMVDGDISASLDGLKDVIETMGKDIKTELGK